MDKQSRDVARVFGRPAAWFVMSTSHLLIAFIAEWIGMWCRQYEIQMKDTIVVKMRGDTPEDEQTKVNLRAQLKAQGEKLWPSYSIWL